MLAWPPAPEMRPGRRPPRAPDRRSPRPSSRAARHIPLLWKPSGDSPCRNRQPRRALQGQPEKSLERALRGWDGPFRARIRLQRHAQGPRERLEHRLALMMRVVPSQVVDMQRHLGVVGKTLEEFVHQIHVEVADQRALELDVVLEARPPGEIDHDARQRLVERYVGMARSEERRVGKECRSRWSPYH